MLSLSSAHPTVSLRCPVCSAEPGNWSELQKHIAEHLWDVFRNDELGDAFLGQAQAGRGSTGAGPSSGETGGGTRAKRTRRHSAPGGRAGGSVSSQRAVELRELTATVFKTYLVPGSESVSEAMAEAGRIYHESAGAIKSRPEAERADAQEQLGPPFVHVWVAFPRSLAATRGLAPEHVAVLKSYWESNVVKSAPLQLAAHVRHCRAKPCKKIEGKEGWTRIVFCLDP